MERIVNACRCGDECSLQRELNLCSKLIPDNIELLNEFEDLLHNNKWEMVRILMCSNALTRETCLLQFVQACLMRQVDAMNLLWTHLCPKPSELTPWQEYLFRCVHVTMFNPNEHCVRFLWRHNLCNVSPSTMLYTLQFACMKYQLPLVRFLVPKWPFAPKLLRAHNNFLFCCACSRGDVRLARLFMQKKCVSQKDKTWLRCAHGHAQAANHSEMCLFLASFLKQQPQKTFQTSFAQRHAAHAQFLISFAREMEH